MFKDIAANLIGRFWSILSNFLFIPLYIKLLGFDSYSIISFSLVVAGLMAMLDAGLTATLSREFARLDVTVKEKINLFKTLETSYFIICSICIFSLLMFSNNIARSWLNLNTIEAEKVTFFLKIVIIDFGFQLIMRFYLGGLLGLQKQVTANIYQVNWGIVRNGLVLIVILILPSLKLFFVWQAVSTVIFTVLIRLTLIRTLTGYYGYYYKPTIDIMVFKKVWRFTGGMLLISLVASLNTQMDKIVISKLLPIKSLGYYTLGVTLSMGIITIINPISTALLPRFTALYSEKKNFEAAALYSKISLFVSIIIFSIMSNMIVFSKELLWIWTGNKELIDMVSDYLPIIAFAMGMLSLQIMAFNVCLANGYTKLNNVLGLLSLFITIPGYWFATIYFGAIGTAYVFCFVQTLTTFFYVYFVNKKFSIEQSFSRLYFKNMLFPFIISLLVAFLFSFISSEIPKNRIFTLLLIGLSAFFASAISVLVLVDKYQVKKIFSFILNFKKK